MPHSFSLSLAAVDILLEHGRFGPAPVPFEVPHIGTTIDQRAMVREAVFRDLEGRGLMRGGRLDADVELALATFVNPQLAVWTVAQMDKDKQLFARAATNGQFGVLARQDENLLVFEETRPTAIVASIVDLLPLTPAGPGQSVTIAKPVSAPKRPRNNDDAYDPFAGVSGPRSHGSNPQQRQVERIFEKPKTRVGQFSVFIRGGQVFPPLAWFDTEAGRYMMTSRRAADGQSWLTYAPADNARIAQQLYAQLEGQF
ncbi:ESX secretion-associated protein EspG [Amycolatopsis orientalis]|uniref:ESX secretion-associated protein EspG n=1 Tax=Amycolatopsis orientalis TaxID=31958 RepID=UPI0004266DE0|nr:ESX secretion-associated protein EspG [Amycolatopsis orientalis]